jgi:hypothetical protein
MTKAGGERNNGILYILYLAWASYNERNRVPTLMSDLLIRQKNVFVSRIEIVSSSTIASVDQTSTLVTELSEVSLPLIESETIMSLSVSQHPHRLSFRGCKDDWRRTHFVLGWSPVPFVSIISMFISNALLQQLHPSSTTCLRIFEIIILAAMATASDC